MRWRRLPRVIRWAFEKRVSRAAGQPATQEGKPLAVTPILTMAGMANTRSSEPLEPQ
jgi:hypothetical protein